MRTENYVTMLDPFDKKYGSVPAHRLAGEAIEKTCPLPGSDSLTGSTCLAVTYFIKKRPVIFNLLREATPAMAGVLGCRLEDKLAWGKHKL